MNFESDLQGYLVVLVQTLTSVWWITGTARAKALASILKEATSVAVPIFLVTNWLQIITPARISMSAQRITAVVLMFVWTRLEVHFASVQTAFIWQTIGKLAKVKFCSHLSCSVFNRRIIKAYYILLNNYYSSECTFFEFYKEYNSPSVSGYYLFCGLRMFTKVVIIIICVEYSRYWDPYALCAMK